MTLLRTKSITVGKVLAYTGAPPEEGQTFLWGNPKEFTLGIGDTVLVIDIERKDGTPWARMTVAVLKGVCCGRTGVVSIDMSARSQRSWQSLTQTGSMEKVRAPVVSRRSNTSYSVIVDRSSKERAPTKPAVPQARVKRGTV
jgi:hypothetical protein